MEEIGYCNGNNRKLNAVEYHRSSEIDIAVNDLIFLFGRQQDIENGHSYDTSLCAMFCRCEGFRCVIVLPKGTNTELDFIPEKNDEGRLITAKNKWLLAYPEAGIEGAYCGLKGKNITI